MNTQSTFHKKDIITAICVCFGFIIMIASCSKDQAEPKKDDPTIEKLTYGNFADALFRSKCSGCHTGSGGGAVKWVF